MVTVDLPEGGEGLAWIAAKSLGQLYLIPWVHEASVLAASLGSLPAVQHLQARAQESVATLTELEASKQGFDSYKECASTPELETRRSYTAQLICQAAREDNQEALQWLRALCLPSLAPGDVGPMEAAAGRGHLSIMKLLQQRPNPAPYDWHVALAALPHWECLDWLCARCSSGGRCWDSMVARMLQDLAQRGCLDAIIQLHQHSGPIVEQHADNGMVIAAKHGHLPIVQLLRKFQKDGPWPLGLCQIAAGRADLTLLQWLSTQDPPCPLNAGCTLAAADAGSLEVLQYLQAQKPPCSWHNGCSNAAAMQGNLPMLQWLRCQKPPAPWSSSTSTAAACSGNVLLFQWLEAQGAPPPVYSICARYAVMNGHLSMLKYLHSLGCHLDGLMYFWAAASSSRHILQWLREQAVPVLDLLPGRLEPHWGSAPAQASMVMFLGDIDFPLPAGLIRKLALAQRAFCTFHGLVRWAQRAVGDPSKRIDSAFNRLVHNPDAEHLLIRLSMLPQPLVDKVATLAEIQHDLL